MGFHVDDADFPAVMHPVVMQPYRDNHTTLQVVQLRPATWDLLAEWCGGEKTVVDGGQAVELPDEAGTAVLGDFVVYDGAAYRIEPAEGASLRLWPRDTADPTDPPLLWS